MRMSATYESPETDEVERVGIITDTDEGKYGVTVDMKDGVFVIRIVTPPDSNGDALRVVLDGYDLNLTLS